MKMKFNSQGFSLVHQHGRRFFVLEHQYGHCDVMSKRSIALEIGIHYLHKSHNTPL